MTVLGAGVLRNVAAVVLILASLAVLFLMYLKSAPSPKCHPAPVRWSESERSGNASGGVRPKKPVLLIWFWPENLKFDLQDCKRHFRIDSCQLSDDKSLAAEANGILIYHKAISEDLSNLPTSRTRVQRWIWFHPDSPSNTRQIPGIEALFNLTLTYRKDADIQKRTVCWIVDTKEMVNNSTQSYETYVALLKYIQVDLFDISSDEAKGEGYLSTIKSCKFYLSFESFVHRDYITEKFTAPLALGTVPVALGPPRKNYENFVPGSSFIHVNDFSDAAALAEHLQSLDRDEQAYLRYFDWRKFYTIGAPFAEEKHRFLHPICQACQHLGLSNVFRYVPDLYKWFL
ncbi:unnamed protein product, partial [Tetraodon nigroviridis]